MKILLVEDDLAHAKMIRRALEKVVAPGDIMHVTDGGEALDYILGNNRFAGRSHREVPQLILLDLRLPRVDGFDVLARIKSDAELRRIPIVVLSTTDRPQDINRCYASGANAFVTKPVDFGEFSRKVVDLCEFWQSTAERPIL